MGLTSMILGNFARRRIFGYRIMILTTLLIGFLGILVWGHHMFVAGLNPFAGTAFSISTMAIAIPAAAKVFSWLATLWRSRPRYPTPMLFALGFVSLFIAGGLTGPILAQPILDQYLHNTYFVVAHFHLIMAMAGIFGLFAATYYWFPLITLDRRPARHCPRHSAAGTSGSPSPSPTPRSSPCTSSASWGAPRHYAAAGRHSQRRHRAPRPRHAPSASRHRTAPSILASAQLLFLVNLVLSLRRGTPASRNPWNATTLEWAPRTRHHPHPINRSACSVRLASIFARRASNTSSRSGHQTTFESNLTAAPLCSKESPCRRSSLPPIPNANAATSTTETTAAAGVRPPTNAPAAAETPITGTTAARPAAPRQRLDQYRLGLFFALSAVFMFFVAIVSVFFVAQGTANIDASARAINSWLPIVLPPILWINTAILLLSSVTIEIARRNMFREHHVMDEWLGLGRPTSRRAMPWVAATIVLGGTLRRRPAHGLASARHRAHHLRQLRPERPLLLPLHRHPRPAPSRRLGALVAAFIGLFVSRQMENRQILVDLAAWYWHSMGVLWTFLFLLLAYWQ